MDIRCDSRIHGVVSDDGLFEVKCRSKRCGADASTTVLHYFDPITWELVKTHKFKEPNTIFHKERIS